MATSPSPSPPPPPPPPPPAPADATTACQAALGLLNVYFPSLVSLDIQAAVARLREPPPPRQQGEGEMGVLDDLLSPFMLIAAAEKMHRFAPHLSESSSGSLPMYVQVRHEVKALVKQLKRIGGTQVPSSSPSSTITTFVHLLQRVLHIVEARIWLCRWYHQQQQHSHSVEQPLVGMDMVAEADVGEDEEEEGEEEKKEQQQQKEDQLLSWQALEGHIRRLEKEDEQESDSEIIALDTWKEVVLAEAQALVSGLHGLDILNHGGGGSLLPTVLQLLQFRKRLFQWHQLTPSLQAEDEKIKVVDQPRQAMLQAFYQHIVNKMPLRFHHVAGQVMDLSAYHEQVLALPPGPSSSSSSPLPSSVPPGHQTYNNNKATININPYIALIVNFLQSYGPTACVCVTIMRKQHIGGGAEDFTNCAYVVPGTSSTNTDEIQEGFVPVFSMTSAQAAAGAGSSGALEQQQQQQQQQQQYRHPPLHSRHPSGSPSSSSTAGGTRPLSSSSSSIPRSPAAAITTAAAIANGGTGSGGFTKHQGPPSWFWAFYDQGILPAIQGQVPEAGQRFSFLVNDGGGGVARLGDHPDEEYDNLEGTFIHQSGSRWRGTGVSQPTFAYFVAHVSARERLVILFTDRSRPATDRVVLHFLMQILSVLTDKMMF